MHKCFRCWISREPFYPLYCSFWMRIVYVRDTRFHESMYRSMHMAMHFWKVVKIEKEV